MYFILSEFLKYVNTESKILKKCLGRSSIKPYNKKALEDEGCHWSKCRKRSYGFESIDYKEYPLTSQIGH